MSTPDAWLVVNVDTDPDPVSVVQGDEVLLSKYETMRRILDDAGARGAWSVLTGPICRTRFLEPPFLSFWRTLRDGGADLVLHPEEDLYGPPPGKTDGRCSYFDAPHMQTVITDSVAAMRAAGLDFDAYRGGYHGLTPQIAAIVRDLGIGIDLACAPGIVWPEKAAAWQDAPLSAYLMQPQQPACAAQPGSTGTLLEIPWAFDGGSVRLARRFVVGESYMINEFSTLQAMEAVWDAVVARAAATGARQVVSMMTHTFAMDEPACRDRLAAILDYVRSHHGRFITPRQAAAMLRAPL